MAKTPLGEEIPMGEATGYAVRTGATFRSPYAYRSRRARMESATMRAERAQSVARTVTTTGGLSRAQLRGSVLASQVTWLAGILWMECLRSATNVTARNGPTQCPAAP